MTMQERWDMKRLADFRDKDVFSSDGEKIGSVKEIYYDDATAQPEWVALGTGFLGMSTKVVPAESLSFSGESFRVPFTKDKVKNEPDFDTSGDRLDESDEQRLCSYFNLTGSHRSTRVLRPGDHYAGPMV